MLTVLEVLRSAAGYLEKKGIESARLNAELLLAHVLGTSRMQLYMEFDRPLGEPERAPLRDLIRARGEGVPVQHLLGTVEFFGREFGCDDRALIPRPETEQFVEFLLVRCPEGTEECVLDVGTGSGVIAVSLALERPSWKVAASDQSSLALDLARENATKLSASVAFHGTDLLPLLPETFSVIAANLPYIPTAEIEILSPEVRHDPREALDGGPDGMDLIRKLVSKAVDRLRPNALLALEIGSGQDAALTDWLKQNNYRDIEAVADYQGVLRFLFARYG